MKLTALALLVCFPIQTMAQELKHIPKWHMVGKEACYSFDEAKKLVELDSVLSTCTETTILYNKQAWELNSALTDLRGALEFSEKEKALLRERNLKMDAEMQQLIERANKAEAGSGLSAGWVVAGGVILLAAGVFVGATLIPRK